MGRGAFLAWMGLVLVGCGSSSSGPAQVTINGVQPGATITLMPDDTYALNFSASNFSLQQQGQCGSSTTCGQAYLNIDGAACNQPNQTYNAITPTAANTSTSMLFANFALCPAASLGGNHQLTVSLHLDSGAQVVGTGNAPAQATVSVVVMGGTVSGTNPADGGTR
ncbi:MAG TPA: hypothetical protein VN853_15265 [Polyangia bacterium]|nr:hypothetical protein [Polyangia bacterium]